MIFLRNLPVDISRYLPLYLKNDPVMEKLLGTHSWEHERLRLAMQDLSNQFFVTTATWGLADWERILELTPKATDSYDDRRTRILVRLQSKQTSTLAFMTRLINLFIVNQEGIITEHPESYTIDIQLPSGQVKDYEGLKHAVDTYIPAHIGYKFIYRTIGNYKIFATQHAFEQEVLSEEIKNLNDSKASWYVGIGFSSTGFIEIRGAELDARLRAAQRGYVVGGIYDTEVFDELRDE